MNGFHLNGNVCIHARTYKAKIIHSNSGKKKNPTNKQTVLNCFVCSLDKARTPYKKNTSFNVFTCILASEDKDVYAFRVS